MKKGAAIQSLYITNEEWKKVLEKHPEWFAKYNPNKKLVDLNPNSCQCRECGHIFIHKDRYRFKTDPFSGFAPAEGRCPKCKSVFTFIGSGINIQPISKGFAT